VCERNYTEEPFCPPSTFFPRRPETMGAIVSHVRRGKKEVMRVVVPPCGIGNLRCYA